MSSSTDRAVPSMNRRRFAQSLAVAGGAAATFAAIDKALARPIPVRGAGGSLIADGDVVLFQGDSITDAGRKKDVPDANSQPALGDGYAWLAAAELLVDAGPSSMKVFNRGISGNKVYQLAERWQADCLDLKPNVLSILIGVNDIWHKLNGQYDGTVEKYQSDYRELLARTRKTLPQVKLVVCEPFVLRCGAVTDKWFPEFDAYREAAKQTAVDAGAVFVPFQTAFDAAAKIAPPERWAKDGVHPTADGAALMAHCWLKAVGAKAPAT